MSAMLQILFKKPGVILKGLYSILSLECVGIEKLFAMILIMHKRTKWRRNFIMSQFNLPFIL